MVGTIGIAAMTAGFGALMPDLDHPDSKASNAVPLELLSWGVGVAGMAIVVAYFTGRLGGDQAVAVARSAFAPLLRGAVIAIVLALVLVGASLVLRAVSHHRGTTHSLAFAAGITAIGSIVCGVASVPVSYGLAFGWGWLTHLITDAMTPAGLPSLYWPFRWVQEPPVEPLTHIPSPAAATDPVVRSAPAHAHEPVVVAQGPARPQAVPDPPLCPRCQIPMVLRTARRGPREGQQFYGCANFPRCRQVRGVG